MCDSVCLLFFSSSSSLINENPASRATEGRQKASEVWGRGISSRKRIGTKLAYTNQDFFAKVDFRNSIQKGAVERVHFSKFQSKYSTFQSKTWIEIKCISCR